MNETTPLEREKVDSNLFNLDDRLRQKLKYMAIFLIISGLIGIIIRFRTIAGDPSIYLVYAKDMFTGKPFTFGLAVKSGATSPIWALLFSLFFLPLQDVNIVMFCMKALSLALFLISVLALWKLSFYIFGDKTVSWISSAILINQGVINGYNLGFETTCTTLFVLMTVYYTIKITRTESFEFKDLAFYVIFSGNLHYLRPEAIIVTIITGLIILNHYRTNQLIKEHILHILLNLIFISFLVSWYYIYFFMATDSFPSSTVLTRGFLRFGQGLNIDGIVGILDGFFTVVANFLTGLIPFVFGIIFIKNKLKNTQINKELNFLLLVIIPFFILFFFYNSGKSFHLVRYIFPIFWVNALIIAGGFIFIYKLFEVRVKKIKFVRKNYYKLLTLSLLISTVAYGSFDNYLSVTRMALDINNISDINVILGQEFIENINTIVDENDRILMLEIQFQYYLKCQAFSMDGIVGGEILPYLDGGNLSQFLIDYNIGYMIVGHTELPQYKNLYELTLHTILGENFSSDGIVYTNVMDYDSIIFHRMYLLKIS